MIFEGNSEKIIDKIIQKTKQEVYAYSEMERRIAQREMDNARKKASKMFEESDEILKKKAEDYIRRETDRLEILYNKNLLKGQLILINKIIDNSREKLKELRKDKRYKDFLKNSIEEGKCAIGNFDVIVEIDKDDKLLIESIEDKASIELSLEPIVGVVIRSKDKKMYIDNTVNGRLERFREEIGHILYNSIINQMG